MRIPCSVRFLLLFFLASSPLLCQAGKTASGAKTAEAEALQRVEKVMEDVALLRGRPFLHDVRKGVVTPKELRAFLLKELKREMSGPRLEATQAAYTALGLIPPGTDLRKEMVKLLSEQVAGFYDPRSKTFNLVKGKVGGAVLDILMAHELTHALDDQYYDLETRGDAAKSSSDREFAFGSVTEGSAVTLQMRFTFMAQARGGLDLKALAAQARMEREQGKLIEAAPPALAGDLLARYTMGMYFLSKGNLVRAKDGCGKTLEKAIFDPPLSSEQILHPRKYWNEKERDDPVEISFPGAGEFLGGEWRCLWMDTLGELQCALLSRPKDFRLKIRGTSMIQPLFWTTRAASGWGGDRWACYTDGKGRTCLVWVAAWDTGKDAEEFLQAFLETRRDLLSAFLFRGKVTAFLLGLGKKEARGVLANLLGKLRFRKRGAWDPGFRER